jgi:hypothetical protein
MKIFVTSFIWDGTEHAGPNIFAENEKVAEAIAEYQGLIIDGEEINEKRVIH